MKTVYILILLSLLVSVLLSACSPIVERKASSSTWVTTEHYMVYKRVLIAFIKFPIYGDRWRQADSSSLTGSDNVPILPDTFDCPKVRPDNPKIGDAYCELSTQYFLVFDEGERVEVTEEVWKNHTSDTIYKTQKTLFGLTIQK